MDCASPITIPDPHIGGTNRITAPCGKCIPCLQSRRSDWSFRLHHELKQSIAAKFITLTYNDEHLPYSETSGLPDLRKQDLQDFIKRLRINYSRYISTLPEKVQKIALKHPSIKHYSVGEYGGHYERPHYHLLLFNLAFEERNHLEKAWSINQKPVGHVHIGSVEMASIHYVTGYIITPNVDYEGRTKPFAIMSKGIGIEYINLRNQKFHNEQKAFYVRSYEQKQKMPRYYKEKFFSKHEISENSKRAKAEAEKADNKEFKKLLDAGENPAFYKSSQVQDQIRKTKNITKNKKL